MQELANHPPDWASAASVASWLLAALSVLVTSCLGWLVYRSNTLDSRISERDAARDRLYESIINELNARAIRQDANFERLVDGQASLERAITEMGVRFQASLDAIQRAISGGRP